MKRFVFLIRLLLVLLMLAFIWGNSLMDGVRSSQQSQRVLEIVEPVVEPVQKSLAARGLVYTEEFLVRKAAHISEFALLGVLMYLLFLKPDGRSRYFMPMLLCLGAAGIDEGIQIFAVDRGPALRDIIIDFTGSCIGIFSVALVVVLLYSAKNRRRREDPWA